MIEVEMEKILKAVANRRRLAILKILYGKNEMSVGAIAKQIKISFRSTSKHLAILYSVGLLKKEQRSLSIFYRLDQKGTKIFSFVNSLK